MHSINLNNFIEIVDGTIAEATPEHISISNISTHSQFMRSETVFFALSGTRDNGYTYVAQAKMNGAVAAVVSERDLDRSDLDLDLADFPIIKVKDTLLALQTLASWWRQELSDNTQVIAVLGEGGKTTTKDCLSSILLNHGPTYASPGSYNSQLGACLAMLGCPKDVKYAIIEVAASEPGEIEALARVIEPHHILVTEVNETYTYGYSTVKEVVDDLLTIISNQHEGFLLLGSPNEYLLKLTERLDKETFLVNASESLPSLDSKVYESKGLRAAITFPGAEQQKEILVHTSSEKVLNNVLLAASAAYKLGCSEVEMLNTIADYYPTNSRLETWHSPNEITVIRCLAAKDPITLRFQIRSALQAGGDGRKFLVLGEPVKPWGETEIQEIAAVMADTGLDRIYGFDNDSHRALAAVLSQDDISIMDSIEDLKDSLVNNLKPKDSCLIQTNNSRLLSELSEELIESLSPTHMHIDLSALQDNVAAFRKLIGPRTKITGMVKAIAYGTDSAAVSHTLEQSGVDFIGVSNIDEGAALRRAGITIPILAMLGTAEEIPKMNRYQVTPVIYSPTLLQAILEEADASEHILNVHLEVDTGMHRSGLAPEQAKAALNIIASHPKLELTGLMNHFASADEKDGVHYTKMQLNRFLEVGKYANEIGLNPIMHAANTAGTVLYPESRLDMVRIGIGLYGVHPCRETTKSIDLKPIARVMSRIIQIVDVPAGEGVGYGSTYKAPQGGGKVGVIPAGYFDGITRLLSNRGYAIIAGRKCEIVGNVSMDSMTVDISQCPQAKVGSEVLIFGHLGNQSASFDDAAISSETISWETMSKIGPRVQRIFSTR